MTPTTDLKGSERAPGADLDLGWLRESQASWGVRAEPSRVGLTLRDIAVGSYGDGTRDPDR